MFFKRKKRQRVKERKRMNFIQTSPAVGDSVRFSVAFSPSSSSIPEISLTGQWLPILFVNPNGLFRLFPLDEIQNSEMFGFANDAGGQNRGG